MAQYNFHTLLFPPEFESLCRGILEIRENPITFTTFKQGKDGGIDFRATKGKEKIVGQCKLYDPNNFNSLFNSLKKEVNKCKKQNPDRYILCTNFHLSRYQADKILELFGSCIQNEEDIIDGEKLDNYLNKSEYDHLLKIYSKLLVPNLKIVENLLEQIVNKKYYNKTKGFLNEIEKQHQLFHNPPYLEDYISHLEKHKVLLLTGNPGVGKTTIAKMIANYFLVKKVKSLVFLSEEDYPDVLSVAGEDQIIIVDDFWGQIFSPKIRDSSSSFAKEFNRRIEYFSASKNSYLILTSREYVIKDVLFKIESETKYLLTTHKFIVNIEDYSFEDKLRIFLNHLLFYDLEKSYFEYIRWNKELEYILNHENYTPRQLEYFIKQYKEKKHQNEYNFYHSFLKYLRNPQEYWNLRFEELNGTSRLILLILLISSDPIEISDLKDSFEAIQANARIITGEEIKPLDFNKNLKQLDDFYLVTDKSDYSNQIFIRFQSPGIKDFLLEYLRTDGNIWITPLFQDAVFFNQLTFVFATEDSEIDDSDSDMSFYGKKIVLNEYQKRLLKIKLLTDFEKLNFSNPEPRDFTDQLAKHHTSDDTKYLKLLFLNNLFSIDSNLDVQTFILNQVLTDLKSYDFKSKVINSDSLIYLPSIIKIIKSHINLNPTEIINIFYTSITFTKEYDFFYKFNEIYPTEFQKFLNDNIQTIRKSIRELILDDIDYYEWYDLDIEYDMHLDYYIEEVCKKYKVRLSEKFISEIEELSGRTFRDNPKKINKKKRVNTKKGAVKAKLKKETAPKYYGIVEEYLPKLEEFEPTNFLKEQKLDSFIKVLKNKDSILNLFTDNKDIFESVIVFIQSTSLKYIDLNKYQFLNLHFEHYCKGQNIEKERAIQLLSNLAKDYFEYNSSITKSNLIKRIEKSDISKYKIETFYPIIIPMKSWYRFSCYDYKLYLIVESLNYLQDDNLYKEASINFSYMLHDIDDLKYLSYADNTRFLNKVIFPELKRFYYSIDQTTEKTTLLSFISFFQIEFELILDKKNKIFEDCSSSNSESFIESAFQFIGIDFNIWDIQTYFIKEFYDKDTIKKLFIREDIYVKLYSTILQIIPENKITRWNSDKEEIMLEIKLSDFANNNFELLKEIGMVAYLKYLLHQINSHINQQI